jgi:Uncharacterized anaerobic dehydrogenase
LPVLRVGCQTKVYVKGDRILYVDGRNGTGNEKYGVCVKGRFGFDYIHTLTDCKKPLIRREDAPKRGDIVVDPRNPWDVFREATWEEALEKAAAGFRRILERDGGQALAGFGSAKGSNEEAYLFQKLIRQGSAPTTSTTARACATPHPWPR